MAAAGEPLAVLVLLGDPRLPDPVKPGGRFTAEDLDSVVRLRAALATLEGYRFDWLDDHEHALDALRDRSRDLVFNLCDTGFCNRPGSSCTCRRCSSCSVSPTRERDRCVSACATTRRSCGPSRRATASRCPARSTFPRAGPPPELDLPFPALVKPASGDGSVGITAASVVIDARAARERIDALRAELPLRDLLVQEFLSGDEYGVGLVGNPASDLEILPLLEVDYDALDPDLPRILAYESKTVPTSPYWRQLRYRAARAGPARSAVLAEHSERLFSLLGCRDYARFDWRAGADGLPRLLEVNPNPAWCWTASST